MKLTRLLVAFFALMMLPFTGCKQADNYNAYSIAEPEIETDYGLIAVENTTFLVSFLSDVFQEVSREMIARDSFISNVAQTRDECPDVMPDGMTGAGDYTFNFGSAGMPCDRGFTNLNTQYEGILNFNNFVGNIAASNSQIATIGASDFKVITSGGTYILSTSSDISLDCNGGISGFGCLLDGYDFTLTGDITVTNENGTPGVTSDDIITIYPANMTGKISIVEGEFSFNDPSTWLDNDEFNISIAPTTIICKTGALGTPRSVCIDTSTPVQIGNFRTTSNSCGCPQEGVLRVQDPSVDCTTVGLNTSSDVYDFSAGSGCDNIISKNGVNFVSTACGI